MTLAITAVVFLSPTPAQTGMTLLFLWDISLRRSSQASTPKTGAEAQSLRGRSHSPDMSLGHWPRPEYQRPVGAEQTEMSAEEEQGCPMTVLPYLHWQQARFPSPFSDVEFLGLKGLGVERIM